jgi:D-alanyl-D-alanine carboxypeptidase
MRRIPVLATVGLLLSLSLTPAGSAVGRRTSAPRLATAEFRASVVPIPPRLRRWMTGVSWHPGCPVALDDLRVVGLTYWGFDRTAHHGRLVVHERAATRIVRVFRAVYDARFPIRRMRLVDYYGADDTRSMDANNTSAFNCRYRDGVCCTWSMHAYGKAIDVNPIQNPYVGPWGASPDAGARYLDRDRLRRGMVVHGDAVWSAFHDIGWPWGGDWTWPVDYQHFSSNGR